MLDWSCLFTNVIKFIKGLRSLGSLFNVKKQKVAHSVSQSVSCQSVSDLLSCQVTAKNSEDRATQPIEDGG